MGNLSDFVIEDGVLKKYIGKDEHVIVPDGVTEIGHYACNNNSTIKSVFIPEGVEVINYGAFENCINLEKIVLPDSLTRLHNLAFDGCKNLRSVYINDIDRWFDSRKLLRCNSKSEYVFYDVYVGGELLTELSYPDTNAKFLHFSFEYCRSIKNVKIPANAKGLSDESLSNFINLEAIYVDQIDSLCNCYFNASRQYDLYVGGELLTELVIPESMTVIRPWFSNCRSIKNIVFHNSVTEITARAFEGCSGLVHVELPLQLEKIGDEAFKDCTSLESFKLGQSSAINVGSGITKGCTALKDKPDFLISGTILKAYLGNDKKVVVPDGITEIGQNVFYGLDTVSEIVLPDSVNKISDGAFGNMEFVELTMGHAAATEISIDVFKNANYSPQPESMRSILHVTLENGKQVSVYIIFLAADAWSYDSKFKVYVDRKSPDMAKYDLDVAQSKRFNAGDKLHAALVRMACPYQLGKNAKTFYTELLIKNAKKAAAAACEGDRAEWLQVLFDTEVITSANFKAISKVVNETAAEKCKALLAEKTPGCAAPVKKEKSSKNKAEAKSVVPVHPIESFCKENFDAKTINAVVKKAITYATPLSTVKYKDTEILAPEFVVKCAIAPYIVQMESRPKNIGSYRTDYIRTSIDAKADEVAAALDQESLQAALQKIAKVADCNAPQCFIPYCRFATAEQLKGVISLMNSWDDWYTYSSSGRSAIIVARGALLLNDSREAMLYADKHNCLHHYASIRGTKADVLRDTVLSDFGLDEMGSKTYDLGNKTITATVQKNLAFELYDNDVCKIVKSLPKKGVDEKLYAAASEDFAEMKKNLKKVVKGRNDLLFTEFLNGGIYQPQNWIASYTKNPVLKLVAQLIVWRQGKNTFILSDNGVVDTNGGAYTINDKDKICVAHPVEMTAEEIHAWQKYFMEHNLKQPFEQIWEPKIDPQTISEDRYEGCKVSVYRFMRNEKHGITFYDNDFHNDIGFNLRGSCSIQYDRTEWNRHMIGSSETFTLGKFTVGKKYGRIENHIVSLLDKWTVADRILKDDVSVAPLLNNFTLAQITDYIKLASENKCTNVTALLLEYKNQKYSDFAEIDEFTLDL